MILANRKNCVATWGIEKGNSVFNQLELCEIRRLNRCQIMLSVSDIIGGFGVEHIPAGRGSKSPSITYVNMGDTYDTTLLYVNGKFRIGDWGSIVERGNYD